MNEIVRRNQTYSETFLAIQRYWYDPTGKETLSPEHQHILERWSFADSLIRMNYIHERSIPDMIRKKFTTISRSTAYEDIRNAKRLFGSISLEDQMYFSTIHYDYALDMLKRARKKGNLIAEERILALMHKIKGAYTENANDEKMKDLADSITQSRTIIVITDPSEVNLKKYSPDHIDRLRKELSRPKTEEYTEFEEVTDGGE